MKVKLISMFFGLALLPASNISNACGDNSINRDAADKGNFLCADCTLADFGAEEMAFIKSVVNTRVDRWRPNQTVTITNGKSYTTFAYKASGNFLPIKTGTGTGPGKKVNYDSSTGQTCEKQTGSSGGSAGFGGGSGPVVITIPAPKDKNKVGKVDLSEG